MKLAAPTACLRTVLIARRPSFTTTSTGLKAAPREQAANLLMIAGASGGRNAGLATSLGE
jgi:hypothetical protein